MPDKKSTVAELASDIVDDLVTNPVFATAWEGMTTPAQRELIERWTERIEEYRRAWGGPSVEPSTSAGSRPNTHS